MQKLNVKMILVLLINLVGWSGVSYAGTVTVTIPVNGAITSNSNNASSPVSINCSDTACTTSSVTFTNQATVTLTAAAISGYRFDHWLIAGTDDASNCNNATTTSCIFTSTATGANVQAVFIQSGIVSVTNAGNGTITSNANSASPPVSINCGVTCLTTFSIGTSVTLTATPNTGYTFAYWINASGDAASCNNSLGSSCLFTSSATGASVEAVFVKTGTQSVSVSKLGNGTITSNQGIITSIDCGLNCSSTFYNNQSVNLTATPAVGYLFSKWSNSTGDALASCNNTTAPTCSFTSTGAATSVQAIFVQSNTVVVSNVGNGTITSNSNAASPPISINCANNTGTCSIANAPTNVVLTAIPDAGYTFSNWVNGTGDAATCNNSKFPTCSFTTTVAGASIQAVFVATVVSGSNLTVIKEGSGSDYGSVDSTPTGISCGGINQAGTLDCNEPYTTGQRVTLTATNNTNGAFFAGWKVYYFISGLFVQQTNICTGLETTCNITMAYETQVRAQFDLGYILSLQARGQGSGTLISSANNLQTTCSGATSDPACTQTYNANRTVTITALASDNSVFRGWTVVGSTGICSDKTPTCTVTMSQSRTVIANFDKQLSESYTAFVIKEGSGTGFGSVTTTTVDPIDCSKGKCSATVSATESVVSFTAKPDNDGVFFAGWRVQFKRFLPDGTFVWDDYATLCTGLQAVCTVTVTSDIRVFAKFDFDIILTVVKNGSGLGSISTTSATLNECAKLGGTSNICYQTFVLGRVFSLTAIPDIKSRFVKWNGCLTNDGAPEVCTVTMDTAKQVTATFDTIDGANLSVTLDSSTGTGTVKSDLLGLNCGSGITGGKICNRNYPFNTTVVLTAIPDPGSQFESWGGDWCAGSEPTCTISLPTKDKNVRATFSKGFKLTLDKQGSGEGTVISDQANTGINCGTACSKSYPENSTITLTAQTVNGSTFQGWGGACSGTQLTCQISMTENRTVTVSFSGVSLGKALDASGLLWSNAGDVPWVGQAEKVIFGGSAAVSGAIKHGQTSSLQTTVTGPGKLSFYWKVSSEVNDMLTFETTGVSTSISGEVDWVQKSFDLPAGVNTLKWTYTKDGDVTQGSDSGWLDKVEFSGGNTLSVINQGSGYGSVMSVPSGINCGGACSATFGGSNSVKLIANTLGGSQFVGWSGDGTCSGVNPTCLVAGNLPHVIIATFNWDATVPNEAALHLGLLNDTGVDWCASNSALYLSNKEKNCTDPSLMAKFPNQDGQTGRDAVNRKTPFVKIGAGGDAGFDYTPLCNNGTVTDPNNYSSCTNIGQDATDWGCTLDNVTGLLWELKTGGQLHSQDTTYSWYVADDRVNGGSKGDACVGETCNTERFVKAVNAQGLCGYNDWRLPTRKELHSIVHHGQSNPAIDISFFPKTSPSGYWTATPAASLPFNAWYVNFETGWDFWDNKSNKQHVRLVRTCVAGDQCEVTQQASNPIYRNARLSIPRVNVESTYYNANLTVVNSNPLTFQLQDAKIVKSPVGRSATTEYARYYVNGVLVLGGVEVGNQHYNAMLQLVPGSNPLRFVLQNAHAMP